MEALLVKLSAFLESPQVPQHTMNLNQLRGYLYAVVAGPGTASREEWGSLIFNDKIPLFDDTFSEDFYTGALIYLYNSIVGQVANKVCVLPFEAVYHADRQKRLESEQWARGFMQGYLFWDEIWSQIYDESQTSEKLAAILAPSIYDEIDAILATISAVADAEYALQSGVDVESLVLMYNRLPETIVGYSRISELLRNHIS